MDKKHAPAIHEYSRGTQYTVCGIRAFPCEASTSAAITLQGNRIEITDALNNRKVTCRRCEALMHASV